MSDAFIPYSRQWIDERDVEAVTEALRAAIVSQGDVLTQFESSFAKMCGVVHAVAVSSGTAALHTMLAASGVGSGSEVVVPALTFAGTSNAVLYTGAVPVFADVDPETNCIAPDHVETLITDRTRAIVAVDFAGHPAAYDALRVIADHHGLVLLADAAHSVGGFANDRPVGSLTDMTAFSLNPVKNMTAAEGGVVVTDDANRAAFATSFRTHGMTRDPDRLEATPPGDWYYEQQVLGFNYKLSELHAALGLSQISRLAERNTMRRMLATRYLESLADFPLELPGAHPNIEHTWHLFTIQVDTDVRSRLFAHLRSADLGVQVHYIPIPLHPFYKRLGYSMDGLPNTARYYRRAISLPLHPLMTDADQERVVSRIREFFGS